jgi:AAA+ superfamily predicted ATPase
MQTNDIHNTTGKLRPNAECLSREINWFAAVVNERLTEYFTDPKPLSTAEAPDGNEDHPPQEPSGTQPPDLTGDPSVYAEFVRYYHLTTDERLLLILALMPYVQPHLLDIFFTVNKNLNRGFTEFGGVKGVRHGGFIPTIETALFLLSKNSLHDRFRLYSLFEPDHIFLAHNIIVLDHSGGEPFYSSTISISEEYVDFFTTGKLRKPQFSIEFPAKQLKTQVEWSDLVIDEHTARQLEEIRIWLQCSPRLYKEWDMGRKLKPGFKALFHGPPGTGKTMTAALLGKLYNLDVYRIDLSMVISKYIGETEKNLEKVFKKAENKNWILFFDEADALFGKRTTISDAHDKYANQEIAYLLQRLEDYPGLVILASNMRSNVDEAFSRRLQAIIHFQKPQSQERFRIWTQAFSHASQPPERNELEALARQYELSGGNIMNVVHYASLMALHRNSSEITMNDLVQGIKKELRKEGKTL